MAQTSRAETLRVTVTDEELLRLVAGLEDVYPALGRLNDPADQETCLWEITGVDRKVTTERWDNQVRVTPPSTGVTEIRLVRKVARTVPPKGNAA